MSLSVKLILLISVSIILVACKNPLGGDSTVSTIDKNFQPGILFEPEPVSVTMSVPFTTGTENHFLFNGLDFSSSMKIEISSDKVRIKPIEHIDGAANSFAGASFTDTQWDSNRKVIRLSSTSNTSRLDVSWTPRWSDIVAYYRMENNWNDSKGTFNGTAVNGPTLSSGTKKIESYSGSFNPSGTDDRVVINDPGTSSVFDFTTGDEITISTWVNYNGPTNDSSYRYIIGKGRTASSSTNQNWGFRALASSTGFVRPSFIYRNSTDTGWNVWSSNYGVPIGAWQHWLVTYKFGDANSIRIYVNGESVRGSWAEGTGAQAPLVNDGAIWIGNSLGASISNFFQGNIDDIAIWRKKLGEDEVRAIYHRQASRVTGTLKSRVMSADANLDWTSLSVTTPHPFYKEIPVQSEVTAAYSQIPAVSTAAPGLSDGLIGHWGLNETSGSTFASSVGTGMNLTAYNSPFSGVAGRFGNGVRLARAASHYLATGNSVSLGSAFTFSIWLNLGLITGEWHTLLANTDIGATNDGFKIAVGAWNTYNNTLRIETGNGISTAMAETPTGVMSTMNWLHVTFTVDRANGTALIYLNGVLRNAGSTTVLTDFKNTGTLYFGRAQNAQGLANGVFDEMALYNRALNSSEVIALYRRGANRIKYQVRTCDTSTCANEDADTTNGQYWRGPDLTNATYFSELNNVNSSGLVTSFANFAGLGTAINPKQWFQYRAIFESDEPTTSTLCSYNSASAPCSPELSSVAIGPNHYDTGVHTVLSKANIGSLFTQFNPNGFSSVNTCTEGVRYTLSPDGVSFYYWDGSQWSVSADTYSTASAESDIAANLTQLDAKLTKANVQVKAFLKSSGTSPCEISNIQIQGLRK